MRVSPEILNLVPYVPGKPIEETKREKGLTSVTKLASNESLLGASPLVKEAISKALVDLHRYPDAGSFELTKAFCQFYNVAPEQVIFGNGSNELIDLLIRVFCEKDDAVLTSKGAFIAYKISTQAARIRFLETPLTDDYRYDLGAMAEILRTDKDHKVRLVFLANPNNPTGTYFSKSEWEQFMAVASQRPDLLVVLDEAYAEFVRAQDCPKGFEELKKYKNVALLRTFSKVYGLASLRLGALITDAAHAQWIHRIRNPFNVSGLAQVAGVAALKDQAFAKQVCELTWEGLDYLRTELTKRGFSVLPSEGNFLMFKTEFTAQNLYEEWLKRGIIVRPVKNYGWDHFLRISVGTREENQQAIKALDEILEGFNL